MKWEKYIDKKPEQIGYYWLGFFDWNDCEGRGERSPGNKGIVEDTFIWQFTDIEDFNDKYMHSISFHPIENIAWAGPIQEPPPYSFK